MVSDKIGGIRTIEQLADVIEIALTYRESVGRDFDQAERQAFRWIEETANLPTFTRQSSRLPDREQDRFAEQLAELERALHPEDEEAAGGGYIEPELSLFDYAEA